MNSTEPKNVHILFVVEKPPKDPLGKEDVRWNNFYKNVLENDTAWPYASSAPHNEPNTRLGENVWMLELKTAMPFLGRLVSVAMSPAVQLRCRTLVLDDAPKWLFPEQQ